MQNNRIQDQVEFIFQTYDKNNSGTIEICELKEYFVDLGMRLSTSEITAIMRSMDINGDGRANKHELYLGLQNAFSRVDHQQQSYQSQQNANWQTPAFSIPEQKGNVYYTNTGCVRPF